MNGEDIFLGLYKVFSWLVGIVTFFAAWAYGVDQYGWFLGLGLCWIPALFIGAIAAVVWPLAAVVMLYLFRNTPAGETALTWIGGVFGAVLFVWLLARVVLEAKYIIRSAIHDSGGALPWLRRVLVVSLGLTLDLLGLAIVATSLLIAIQLPSSIDQPSTWTRIWPWLLAGSTVMVAGFVAWRRWRSRRAWYDLPVRADQ